MRGARPPDAVASANGMPRGSLAFMESSKFVRSSMGHKQAISRMRGAETISGVCCARKPRAAGCSACALPSALGLHGRVRTLFRFNLKLFSYRETPATCRPAIPASLTVRCGKVDS